MVRVPTRDMSYASDDAVNDMIAAERVEEAYPIGRLVIICTGCGRVFLDVYRSDSAGSRVVYRDTAGKIVQCRCGWGNPHRSILCFYEISEERASNVIHTLFRVSGIALRCFERESALNLELGKKLHAANRTIYRLRKDNKALRMKRPALKVYVKDQCRKRIDKHGKIKP